MAIVGITALGPILGAAGYYLQIPAMFWMGALISVFTLYMDLASNTIKFPFTHIAFIVVGGYLDNHWLHGAAAGLFVHQGLEAIMMTINLNRTTSCNNNKTASGEIIDADFLDTIQEGKIVVQCPECSRKLRIPSKRQLLITCTACKHKFEYDADCQ